MDMRQLGHRIKSQREKRRLRQSDIAGALQISAQAVSKWERGENAPDIAALPVLCRLLDVSIEWLLTGNEITADTFPATVFCTGLNGYAARSASLPPRDTAAWANSIYYTLTESLLRFDGVPIKYVGDGSLGFFAGAAHARRAFDAALAARRALASPDLVIALHSGDIFLGTIGHPDYARPDIIGQTVNTAFLTLPYVSEHCKSGIGVTAAAAELLEGEFELEPRGEVSVLGAPAPVAIFELNEILLK